MAFYAGQSSTAWEIYVTLMPEAAVSFLLPTLLSVSLNNEAFVGTLSHSNHSCGSM